MVPNWMEELERLMHLRDSQAISEEEFQRERDAIMAIRSDGGKDYLSGKPLPVGSLIRDYRIVNLEGQGAFGQVYKVEHENPQIAKVQGFRALKLMHPEHLQDTHKRERFISEAVKGLELNSPHIAKTFNLIDDEHKLGMFMEYIEGPTLADLGIVSIQDICSLLYPIAETLDMIHKKGVIHRDIKPANIKLHKKRGVVILDFGISKDLNLQMTKTSLSLGTPAYMSPEQTNAKTVTGAADQYSLAMMVYFLLVGDFPWDPSTPLVNVLLMKHTAQLTPICERLPSFSEEASSIVSRALSSNPNSRFPTCVAFLDALSFEIQKINTPQQKSIVPDSSTVLAEEDAVQNETSTNDLYSQYAPTQPEIEEKEVPSSVPSHTTTKKMEPKDMSPPKNGLKKILIPIVIILLIGGTLIGTTSLQSKKSASLQPTKNSSAKGHSTESTARGYSTKLIAAGDFQMGCHAKSKEDCQEDAPSNIPSHKVTLSEAFFMMDSEVTQNLYQKIIGSNPSKNKKCDKCPVENVSWFDAVNFANNLSKREGLEECYHMGKGKKPTVKWKNKSCKGWRLPTEAEWEYAARSGTSKDYAGSNSINKVGWYKGNAKGRSHPVKDLQPNEWGLYDMSGNVSEWIWDSSYRKYKDKAVQDPLSEGRSMRGKNTRMFRGGNWNEPDFAVSVSFREMQDSGEKLGTLGFRLVRNQ